MRYERYFFIVIFALIWVGVLDVPLDYLSGAILNGLDYLAALPFMFM
jgi:hypothetical protein